MSASIAAETETSFDPATHAAQEASDAAVAALSQDHQQASAAANAAVPGGPERPPPAEVPFPTPEDDGGAYYWDAATMAPLNAVSAVST